MENEALAQHLSILIENIEEAEVILEQFRYNLCCEIKAIAEEAFQDLNDNCRVSVFCTSTRQCVDTTPLLRFWTPAVEITIMATFDIKSEVQYTKHNEFTFEQLAVFVDAARTFIKIAEEVLNKWK